MKFRNNAKDHLALYVVYGEHELTRIRKTIEALLNKTEKNPEIFN